MKNKKDYLPRLDSSRSGTNRQGITLIEVIAVIAIISIFSVISYKQLADNRHHAEVEAVANEIAANINQARNAALTGKKVDGVVPGCFAIRILSGFGAFWYDRFLANDECGGWAANWEDWELISQKVTLSGFVSVFGVSNEAFRYKVPNGERLYGTMGGDDFIIVESNADFTIQKTVRINDYRAYVE